MEVWYTSAIITKKPLVITIVIDTGPRAPGSNMVQPSEKSGPPWLASACGAINWDEIRSEAPEIGDWKQQKQGD